MTREDLRALIREVIAEATADMKAELATAARRSAAAAGPHDLATEPEVMTIEKGLLTEKHLNAAARKSLDAIHVAKLVVVTPLARDAARSKGIRIERID